MNVAELVRQIAGLPTEDVPAILAACASRLAETGSAAPEPHASEPDDINLSIEQAAARLHRSTKWIYRHRATLPFVRKLGPRSYICSQNALNRWLAHRPC